MKFLLHKANSRGYNNYGWLETYHTFSFANYNNPDRMCFGALRVLNDDTVLPGEGFGRHPHDNMEIISIPLEGKIKHLDSMDNESVIETGEIQVMSAGTGIFHEEYNYSKVDTLKFLQIWIYPNKMNVKPRYEQRKFDADQAVNNWQTIVSDKPGDALMFNQRAKVSRIFLQKGHVVDYYIQADSFGAYIFVIDGKINIDKIEADSRDAIGIYEATKITIAANKDSYILNMEVPQVSNYKYFKK